MKKILSILFLFVFSLNLFAGKSAFVKELSRACELAGTCEELGEPFPVLSYDLAGMPVFKGFSSEIFRQYAPEIFVLSAYASNDALMEKLRRQSESGDEESALALFVLADRVFPPRKREKTFRTLGKIFAAWLPAPESPAFKKEIGNRNPALLFALWRHCEPELRSRAGTLPEAVLAAACERNDAAFKALVDLFLRENRIDELNKSVRKTRASFRNDDRKILLDIYARRYGVGTGCDWKTESAEIVSARFNRRFREGGRFAILASLNMLDARERAQMLFGLSRAFISETYPALMDSQENEREFWAYMIARSEFSEEAFDVLFDFFVREKDVKNAEILLGFVESRAKDERRNPATSPETVRAWCREKRALLAAFPQTQSDAEAIKQKIEELNESGCYENEMFEKLFQQAIGAGTREKAGRST